MITMLPLAEALVVVIQPTIIQRGVIQRGVIQTTLNDVLRFMPLGKGLLISFAHNNQ